MSQETMFGFKIFLKKNVVANILFSSGFVKPCPTITISMPTATLKKPNFLFS